MVMSLQFRATRIRPSGRRPGFSMVEMVIAMVIAGIIASFAIPSFNNVQQNRMAMNARDSFMWMSNRARSRAIEMGTTWLLEVDPTTERAWIVRRNPTVASDTLQKVDFPTQYASTISTAANTLVTICYNSRGFAWACAAGSPGSAVDVTFTHARRNSVVRIRPLGQVTRL